MTQQNHTIGKLPQRIVEQLSKSEMDKRHEHLNSLLEDNLPALRHEVVYLHNTVLLWIFDRGWYCLQWFEGQSGAFDHRKWS